MLIETTAERRSREFAVAARVKASEDVTLPEMPDWNYSPCRQHDELTPGCRQCGIKFRKHQRKGISWLYFARLGLLADSVGTGKTAQLNGVTALRRMRGEVSTRARVLIVVRPQAVNQWARETHRMLPLVPTIVASGTVAERVKKYAQPWEICIISWTMLSNDISKLLQLPIRHLQVDDVDALRNAENRSAYCIKRLSRDATSVAIATGTPLQKRLHELYNVLDPLGGRDIFGSPAAFKRRYVRTEPITKWTPRGKKTVAEQVVGYKNLDEFKRLIEPLALRRTAADIDDVDLPTIIPVNPELELYPLQRARYKELQAGVITLLREDGPTVTQATAMGKIHHGARICAGLGALGEPDAEETSIKFDWIMDKLTGDLSEEKVVIFIHYKDTIKNIAHPRLTAAGIRFETIWGDDPDKAARERAMERFWEDPNCRVLIGTTAIEQSLNLQCARHLINVDMILNPSRMEQLAGRIRRDGSAFPHVYVHNLLTQKTQEAKYLPLLEREQALIDHVWDQDSELFDALSPSALLQLIGSN